MNRKKLAVEVLLCLLLISSMVFAIYRLTVDEGYLPLESRGITHILKA
ncbi:hypothetical protein ABPH35_08335 [Streptococcus sp. ZJ93]